MIIRDVINYLEELAPLSYAEDFDNVGVLVGDAEMPLTNVLVTLDTLESTVEEAIAANCNLIVSFHPILFKGLKRITGQNYVEKAVIKAIKNDIVIYAMHTALDNMKLGVSGKMAEMLGLSNIQVLVPKSKVIKKLLTYVPHDYAEKVRQALFNAGAGQIGNYDNCSFSSGGIGTYIPNEKAKPTIGAIGKLQEESETAITVTFEKHLEKAVLRALFKEHPYEEVAFEMSTLDNIHQNIGLGVYGDLHEDLNEKAFMKVLKKTFKTGNIRHSQLLDKPIRKVALLGGSGSFAIKNALMVQADAFVSADFKYHDFFNAENKILITDIGHYESEQYTKNLLVEYLTKKFTNFAIILAKTNTNPIYNY